MNDFEGLLSSDYGFKPQGKSAPMASAKSNSSSNSTFNYEIGGGPKKASSVSFLDDHDTLFRSSSSGNRKTQEFSNLGGLDDVFGGAANSKSKGNSTVNLDSIFGGGAADSGSKFSSLPVFDKPVYDDEVFEGASVLKSSSSAKYEDVFTSSSSSFSTKKNDAFDDLLGGFGRKDPEPKSADSRGPEKGTSNFDDLLPGFGGSTASADRASSGSSRSEKGTATKKTSSSVDDPFVVLDSSSPPAPSPSGLYSDPLEQFSKLSGGSSTKKAETSSVSGGVFDDIDSLDGFGKSIPAFARSPEKNAREKDGSPARVRPTVSGTDKYSVRSPEKKMAADDYQESPPDVFDMPSFSADSNKSVPNASSPPYVGVGFNEPNSQGHVSPDSADNVDSSEEIWLTVSEIPLFTEPTTAPPPSRPPPPRPVRSSKVGAGSYAPPYTKKNADESSQFSHSSTYFQSPNSASAGATNSFASPIDELEEFGIRSNRNDFDHNADVPSGEGVEANSDAAASAAAMKEAMDRAEAKFRHAKGVREKENAKAARMQHERGEMPDIQEREYRERLERERQLKEREEEERRMKEEEERRRTEKLREEKEREQRRRERDRELARQAVERATREARERASIEARSRAEKVAVERAQAEARQRAERAAVQRAQAEARERAARAAAEAKEKAEREARERARADAKEKEALERAAAAAKASQQNNENDLDSFFGTGSRASSAPRPRASSSDPFFDAQFQSKQSSEAARASVNSASNIRKASSSASIVDDLSSIFGGAPSAGEFQDVEGETEERRRARLERHQRTKERAAKALAEKNQRDLDAQREQSERHRIAETLDVEIKRWSTGKEGNLRALLSTLQYVLWPECGWQPVSLTDLITAASVKKVYRKATLCIHPDKVQQKGANLQQKYIAEKVFDLLKEAWNKFNSEELF